MSQQSQPNRFATDRHLTLDHVTLLYGVFSILWFAGSSWLLWAYIDDPSLLIRIELAKGLLFVAVTTGLAYLWLRFWKQTVIRKADQFLRSFRTLPFIGMAIMPPDMRGWLQFNDRLCVILGYSPEELSRKNWAELMHLDDLGVEHADYDRMLRNESEGYLAKRRFLRSDGSVVLAMIDVRCMRRPDGAVDCLIVTLQDITERSKHETRIGHLSQLCDALSQCSQAIAHSSSSEQLFRQVCETAVRIGGMKMAWIGMADEDGYVYPVASFGASLERLENMCALTVAGGHRGQEPVGCAIREDGPVWNQDFLNGELPSPWHESGRRFGWRSAAALPLRLNGKTVGVYALYSGEVNAFDDIAQSLLISMAHDIGLALESFERKEGPRQPEETVRESENRFRSLFQNAPLPYHSIDTEGKLLEVNDRWLSILGYQREEVLGRYFGDFVTNNSLFQLNVEFPHFREHGKIEDVCYEMLCEDGSARLWVVSGQIAHDNDGNFMRTHCIFTDITERRKTEEQLQLAAKVFEQSGEGIIMTDASNCIVMVNKAFSEISGYSSDEALGKNPSLLASGKHDPEFYRGMWEAVEKQGRWQGEIWNRKKNGDVYPEWLSISRVVDANGRLTHYIGIFSDLTVHKATQEHINRLAHFDALTGLPNRVLLGERSRLALSLAQRKLEPLALMFIDLDHFKNINDSLGHRIGDNLLVQFSQRLNAIVREQDTLSRLGGDEFILVLPGTSVKGAAYLAERLLETTEEPYHIEGHELGITCSIGIAVYPKDGRDLDALSQSADVAMYRAKQNGRNTYCFFTSDMHTHSARALEMENALRRALERNQLSLHYQPQISIADGRIVGAEALLRWHHPKFGTVPPSEFIPVAESSGLIMTIGEWVLRTAIKQIKEWLDKGFDLSTVAVNLSAVQFRHPHLSDLVIRILHENGVAPRYLELELTEGAAMENPMAAIAVMDRLHENGIRMSIDDFGIGHSSLGYLKRFRVYKLKIDRAFVRDIPNDPDDTALVGAVISLASSMGLRTIAEGVENELQVEFLRTQGCDEIQGHYFSKALPADQMEKLLQPCKPDMAAC